MRAYIFYIVIGCLISSIELSAQQTRYTFHDEENNQLKEIYHVSDTNTNVLDGTYLSYYINGNIESKGQFSNNQTTGEWEFYYETGKLKMRGLIEDNSNDGYWEYYYEHGHKSMEGHVVTGVRQGEWKLYYESGALKEKGTFVDNKREGNWSEYYEDGALKGEINYDYGKGKYTEYYPTGERRAEGPRSNIRNVGIWKYYYKDGVLQAHGQFVNGKKSGTWKFYHHNGQVSAEGEYEGSAPDGEWSYYYKNGALSSKGSYSDGKKHGYWGLFHNDGSLKGETPFENGVGSYTEYYSTGEVKIKGVIDNGSNEGLWKYYYKTGELEGECKFKNGRGEYFGYYPDGSLQTKGIIDNGKKVGKWDLYKNDGSLSGYFKPIYDKTLLKKEDLESLDKPRRYGVADFRYRRRSVKYFQSKINEFQGVIVGANPFFSFIGKVPVGMEFYLQERLGHEFEFEGIRNPFFARDNDMPLNEVYKRGYSIAVKQKFYNEGGEFGLCYFGHTLRFANLSHYANVAQVQTPENVIRANANEKRVDYMLLLGYRLMQNTRSSGFTADAFISAGAGYRSFAISDGFEDAFDKVAQGNVPFSYNFGLNLGYTFSFGARGRK